MWARLLGLSLLGVLVVDAYIHTRVASFAKALAHHSMLPHPVVVLLPRPALHLILILFRPLPLGRPLLLALVALVLPLVPVLVLLLLLVQPVPHVPVCLVLLRPVMPLPHPLHVNILRVLILIPLPGASVLLLLLLLVMLQLLHVQVVLPCV